MAAGYRYAYVYRTKIANKLAVWPGSREVLAD